MPTAERVNTSRETGLADGQIVTGLTHRAQQRLLDLFLLREQPFPGGRRVAGAESGEQRDDLGRGVLDPGLEADPDQRSGQRVNAGAQRGRAG